MTITATCGHRIPDNSDDYFVKRKGYSRNGFRVVSQEMACMKCQIQYRAWGDILDTEADEQAWVNYGKALMTEILTKHLGVQVKDKDWQRCHRCRKEYGYRVNNGEFLRVGGLLVKFIRATCPNCGVDIWWSSADRHLKKIIDRRIKE